MFHNVNEGNGKCKAKDKVISLEWLYGIFDQDKKKFSVGSHVFSVCAGSCIKTSTNMLILLQIVIKVLLFVYYIMICVCVMQA